MVVVVVVVVVLLLVVVAGVAPGWLDEVPVPPPPLVEVEVVVVVGCGVRSRESKCATSVMVSRVLGFKPCGIASVLLRREFVDVIFVLFVWLLIPFLRGLSRLVVVELWVDGWMDVGN